MSGVEKMKSELCELNSRLSGGISFIEAMALTKQVKELEERIAIATASAGQPRKEPEPYAPGGKATEMRRQKHDLSSPHGNGHDSLKVVEKLWTR